jgi:hypothetical protein
MNGANAMRALTLLKTSIVINMVAGGLLLAAASHPALATVGNLFFDLVFWPLDGGQAADTPTARFASGIGGGAFFGWGIASWIVVTQLMPKDQATAKRVLRSGFIAWFCLDGLASLLAGAPLNALVFNVIILASLLVPLHFATAHDGA